MTALQQAHKLIDDLNPNGLNYIIGVLNGLDADNWVNVPVKSEPENEKISEKRKAFQELKVMRKQFSGIGSSDLEKARMEGLMEKYGDLIESFD